MSGHKGTPPKLSSMRRPSNPFTKNQDERDLADKSSPTFATFASSSSLISRFRDASIGSNNSDTIEEQDDEDNEPVPFKNQSVSPTKAHLGSARGAGTGVFEKSPKSSSNPEGFTFKPSLRPAGGSQRKVAIDDIEDPDKLYSKEQELEALSGGSVNRSSSADASKQMGTGRSRGVVRTYSMAQQKRRPAIMNDDRIIRQRRLSHGEFISFTFAGFHY